MPLISDIRDKVAAATGAPRFKKRVNPHGRDLRKNNKYYKPPKNHQIFCSSGGNCVWYAYGRFLEVWDTAPEALKSKNPWPGEFSGNGVAMVKQAGKKGFKTGLTPKVGAIISWGSRSLWGNYGHVAFVEDVHLNSSGKVDYIEISHSSAHKGDMRNMKIKPGTGQVGAKGYPVWNGYYFNGFAYNPITFAGSSGVVEGGGTAADDESGVTGTGINFAKRASMLSSSDNFEFITRDAEEENPVAILGKDIATSYKSALESIKNLTLGNYTKSTPDYISDSIVQSLDLSKDNIKRIIHKKSYLSLGDSFVEAPYVELDIYGYKIGSYRGSLDEYPNYISSLNVTKQNGVINQYKISLVHQIRAGDDPNLLDELLSMVRYNEITIRYGDLNTEQYYQDNKAIITNVTMNRDYSGMKTTYTLECTSAGQLVKTYTTSFPARTAKPSTVLREVLYDNSTTSNILLEAFPGMRNKTLVESKNLIPTNDNEVELQPKYDVNTIDYINYLVGCMSNSVNTDNVIRNSTYYITYNDSDQLIKDGSYFKISEVTAGLNPFAVTDKIYEITVGYNDNIVYDFNVDYTQSWELLYKNNTKTNEYLYTVTNNGDIMKYYSPSVSSSTNIMNEVNKNWWTQMIKFPLTGSITLKGLLKPIMLMDYIKINVVFYGQQHITSGVYAITGQEDTLSGSGFRTTLSLVRVTDNV